MDQGLGSGPWQSGYAFSVSASRMEEVKSTSRTSRNITDECHSRMSSANSVADTDWNWMSDTRGIRAVPLGLVGRDGPWTQGSDKARETRLVSPWALMELSLRDECGSISDRESQWTALSKPSASQSECSER